ncbi:putative transposase for insertion sequence element ISRM3-like [Rickettsiales endosymbiont of Trichoplax sp. H2]|nr:putative transposase for insertion sequence element ISRM3-like [Rickettsiales endosymbiont of Trichoplax sp. H2]
MVTQMAQKVSKKTTDTATKLVDELLSQVDPSEILAKDGLFSKLKKQLVERVLQSELEHELGYDKHSKKEKKSGNRRNGSYNKTIIDNEGNKVAIDPYIFI